VFFFFFHEKSLSALRCSDSNHLYKIPIAHADYIWIVRPPKPLGSSVADAVAVLEVAVVDDVVVVGGGAGVVVVADVDAGGGAGDGVVVVVAVGGGDGPPEPNAFPKGIGNCLLPAAHAALPHCSLPSIML